MENSWDDVVDYMNEINVNYEQVIEYDSQIANLRNEYNKYYGLKSSLLGDLKEGLINKNEFDEFHSLYERKCSDLEKAIDGQKKLVKDMFQNGIAAKSQLDKFRQNAEIIELSRELLVSTICKIYVHEDKRLEIEFRFANEFEKLGIMNQLYQSQMQEVR